MDDFNNSSPLVKSKSQRKRDMQALGQFAKQLVALKPALLNKMALATDLTKAIQEAQTLHHSRGALKRQMQYLTNLLVEQDVDALQNQLTQLKQPQVRETQLFKKVQAWRDRLINEGAAVVPEIIAEFPNTNRQELTSLVQQAQFESAQGLAPHAKRRLFRYLHQLIKT